MQCGLKMPALLRAHSEVRPRRVFGRKRELCYFTSSMRRTQLQLAFVLATALSGLGCGPAIPEEITMYRVGPCDDFSIDADRVWNEPTRRRLDQRLAQHRADYVEKTWHQARAEFDAFKQRWVADSRRACYETVVQRTLPRASYAAMSACFDTALVQQKVVIDRLADADAETLGNTYDALYEMQRAIETCEVPALYQEYLGDLEAKDAAALSRTKTSLAESRVFLVTGKAKRALEAAERAEAEADQAGVDRVRARALLEQGRALEAMARYREAGARIRIALDMFYEQKSPGGAAEALETLSRVQRGEGRYELAASRQGEALAIDRATLGPTHVEVGLALTGLANAKKMLGYHREALEDLRAAEHVYAETLEPGHPFLLRNISDMSAEWAALGEFDQALEAERGALAAAEARLGDDHPEVSRIRHEIAQTLLAAGRPEEALTEARLTLVMREKALGPQHPAVAVTLQLIAELERHLGDYKSALAHLERVLTLRQKALGPQHRLVGESYEQLGLVLAETGDSQAALENYDKALAIDAAALGQAHPRVLALEQRIGDTLLELGRAADARQMFERVRLDLDERFGPTHPNVAAVYASLGHAEEAEGHSEAARAHYERVLAMREATLPETHIEVARASADLARVLTAGRQFGEALPLAQRAAEIFEHGSEATPLETADNLVTLGAIHLGLYQRAKAIEAWQRALASYRVLVAKSEAELQPARKAQTKLADLSERLTQLGVPVERSVSR